MKLSDYRKRIKEALQPQTEVAPVNEIDFRDREALGVAEKVFQHVKDVVEFSDMGGATWYKVVTDQGNGIIKKDRQGKWFKIDLKTKVQEPIMQETISRGDLKEVVKATLRTVIAELNRHHPVLSNLEEGIIDAQDLMTAWREDQSGEYIQINPDDSVWYVAHGRPREQIAPKGAGDSKFRYIGQWMKKNQIFFNIWQVNDHGNVELYNRSGKPLGGIEERLYEITVTGAVAPINLPGNVKGGWVSGKGGSARGLAGSKSLGYELTPIGKKDMARKQDPVY